MRLRIHLKGITRGDAVTFALNGIDLGGLEPVDGLAPSVKGHWLECVLKASQVKVGANLVRLSRSKRGQSSQGPILLDGVLLHVRHHV